MWIVLVMLDGMFFVVVLNVCVCCSSRCVWCCRCLFFDVSDSDCLLCVNSVKFSLILKNFSSLLMVEWFLLRCVVVFVMLLCLVMYVNVLICVSE